MSTNNDMNNIQFQESIDTFEISFEGENKIDAELLAKTINNTVEMVKESANIIDPNSFLRLEITANKEGSFIVVIDAVVRSTIDLLTAGSIMVAHDAVAVFCGLFELKNHLLGEKPKTIEAYDEQNVVIKNNQNCTIIIAKNTADLYFKDPKMDDKMNEIFNDLKEYKKDGFCIRNKSGETKYFSKRDYNHMSKKIVEDGLESNVGLKIETQILKNCELTIKKPDFLGDSKWEMIFARKIDVKIEDVNFLNELKKGTIKLSGGCKLVCDLKIQTEIDAECNVIKAEHTVIKVHGIKDREEQLEMF